MLIAERLITPQQLVVILSLSGHLLANLSKLLTRLSLARCRYLGAGIEVCQLVLKIVTFALQ